MIGFALRIRHVLRAASRPRIAAPTIVLCGAIGLLLHPGLAQQTGGAKSTAQPAIESADPTAGTAGGKGTSDAQQRVPSRQEAIERIAASGRVLQIGETSSSRLSPAVRLAPGAPPILAFRYFDGQARHRFGDLDLVMDDAGH